MHLSTHLISLLAIGAVLGLVSTAGIYFDPRAGGKVQIICAGGIRGLLVALLVASTTPVLSDWLMATALGAIYGAVIGFMIVLSHGSEARHHALYVLPPSVISGGLIGVLIGRLGV
jgi:hypothetical protein